MKVVLTFVNWTGCSNVSFLDGEINNEKEAIKKYKNERLILGDLISFGEPTIIRVFKE